MISPAVRFIWLFLGFGLPLLLSSCSESSKPAEASSLVLPPKPQPKGYVCYRATSPVLADGVLNEKDWAEVPWTDFFGDIEGTAKPAPRLKTRAKMLWDDTNLYIAAELEEPHVWATLKQRDTVIFYDNDFEVFIDPDWDTHAYYELEVNAFGTAWDLMLLKPYRDGGLPVNGWNINGLQVGTAIEGTVNNPTDIDKGWTVELILPLSSLAECALNARAPTAGNQWRIDFSRVEWHTRIENGTYRKEINPQTGKPLPEDNWVWSPQGRINMHMPEMWGVVQFSAVNAGAGTESYVPDRDLDIRWALRMIYYAEFEYFLKHGTYTTSLSDLGLKMEDFPQDYPSPIIQATSTTFESKIRKEKDKTTWTIYQDSRILPLHDGSLAK
jgi:hypothetical protein